jgi:hypothetical protein
MSSDYNGLLIGEIFESLLDGIDDGHISKLRIASNYVNRNT